MLFLQAASYVTLPTKAQFIEFGDSKATSCSFLAQKGGEAENRGEVYLALNDTQAHKLLRSCVHTFLYIRYAHKCTGQRGSRITTLKSLL